MSIDLNFTIDGRSGAKRAALRITQAVIAGWTGRDPVARDHHIAELEAIGIARPASTPIYYCVAARRITTASTIECSGGDSSGEVEFVLIANGGVIYVGVGSDHTDRKVETYGVTVSKQMCDKPIAPALWPFDEVIGHWEEIVLRSYATIRGARVLYQEGRLDAILAVSDLLAKGFDNATLPDGCVLFGGTFAAKGGIRPASRFDFEIDDPVMKRRISHGYDIVTLPILG